MLYSKITNFNNENLYKIFNYEYVKYCNHPICQELWIKSHLAGVEDDIDWEEFITPIIANIAKRLNNTGIDSSIISDLQKGILPSNTDNDWLSNAISAINSTEELTGLKCYELSQALETALGNLHEENE